MRRLGKEDIERGWREGKLEKESGEEEGWSG